jgi:hypothetical protein
MLRMPNINELSFQSTNLSKEVVQHLTKEIETQINNVTVWRSRVSLSVFLGPFIILGSLIVGLKGSHISWNKDWHSVLAIIVICACFILLGLMSAVVDDHVWDQCNKWRGIIARLQKDPNSTVEEEDLLFHHKVKSTYIATYSILLLSFLSAVVIVSHLQITDKPAETNMTAPAKPEATASEAK